MGDIISRRQILSGLISAVCVSKFATAFANDAVVFFPKEGPSLTRLLASAALSGLGPTGALLGKGGVKAANFGYSNSAGVLNHGATRFGWGYRASDNSTVLRAVVDGVKTDIPGTAVPAAANGARDGAVAGAYGGSATAAGAAGLGDDCECQ